MSDEHQKQELTYLKSERHFRLYETYIKEIIDAFPSVCVFTPKPPVASAETLASRIRICGQALLDNYRSSERAWETEISTIRMLHFWDEVAVSTTVNPGKVTCGPRNELKAMRQPGAHAVAVETVVDQVIPKVNLVNCEDKRLIESILYLHHSRILTEPSQIETPLDLVSMVGDLDVMVQVDPNNANLYTIF